MTLNLLLRSEDLIMEINDLNKIDFIHRLSLFLRVINFIFQPTIPYYLRSVPNNRQHYLISRRWLGEAVPFSSFSSSMRWALMSQGLLPVYNWPACQVDHAHHKPWHAAHAVLYDLIDTCIRKSWPERPLAIDRLKTQWFHGNLLTKSSCFAIETC